MARSKETTHGVLLPLAARVATIDCEAMENDAGLPGLLLHFSVSALVAAPSVQPNIQYYDEGRQQWVNMLALTPKAAVAESNALIHPSDAWDALYVFTDEIEGPLPVIWRLNCVHANANSITYSVSYCYLP